MKHESQLPLWTGKDRRPLDVRYHEWRATSDGIEVFAMIERQALNAIAAGEERIEINLLYAQVRRVRHKAADNSFRAPLARELIDRHPQLAGVIHVKKRKGDKAA
jgi:hypothetical protein